jgi:hypothetical protein
MVNNLQNMAEDLTQQGEAIEKQISARSPENRVLAGFSRFASKVRANMRKALVLIVPAIMSCGSPDDMRETASAAEQGQVPDSAETADWKDRKVDLYYDGQDWHFEGKYPSNFKLTVFVDGKPVYNQPVDTKNGGFSVAGKAGDSISQIDIQAFNADEADQEDIEIPIEPDPLTEGMVGNPHFDNVEQAQ